MAKKPTESAGTLSLAERMMKNSTSKLTAPLDKSVLVNQRDIVSLPVIGMNLAFSGEVDGGFTSSITTWAGPSKHFKTLFALIQVKAYLDRYPDGVCLLYDSEFGSPLSYFTGLGIDPARVIHTPVLTLEELRHDITNQLKDFNRGDRVITMIDSVGNLASKKETEDAESGGDKSDMTRAKVAKSLFRIITPHFALKDIPLVVVNHTYQCGTEKMLVKTPFGSKSLKDIIVGDEVITSRGTEKVTFVTSIPDAPVTDIELEDGTILSFTANHRFKVNGKWIYVRDLEAGMILDKQD
jgi:hypothetical protein